MIVKVTEENFEQEVKNSTQAVLVMIYAEKCHECVEVIPVYEKVAAENSSSYKFCNWEVVGLTPMLRQFKIMSTPTFLFFREGKLIHRKVGIISEKRMLNYLKRIAKLKQSKVASKELKGVVDWSFLRFWE